MSRLLKVGLAGSGIGRLHLAAFASLPSQFQVVAVCDIDPSKAGTLAAQYDVPRVVTDMTDLCRMDDVDVIDLCTPSFLHYEQTLQVLDAGKHVICEKPVARSLQEVDEIMAVEKQSGKHVMPIFQYRFGCGLQKLKRLVRDGVAGRAHLTTVETAWRRRVNYYATWHGKWKMELGGAMVTLAVHAHDALYYILGPAQSVFARTATRVNPIETEDCVSASLEMADGSLCSLSVTTGSTHQISRHRFCFSHLTAESNTQPYTNTSDPWTFTGDSPEIDQRIQDTLTRLEPLPEGFAGQFYRFHQALHRQAGIAELPVTLADARAALELITAVYFSARTDQVVRLPIGQAHPYYTGWLP